jgi:hypothetical protein
MIRSHDAEGRSNLPLQRSWRLSLSFLLVLLLAQGATARADGCVVPPDPQLWAYLREGQQTAVVNLSDADHAAIDLFVSMLDESGQSHEVVFYVPLGAEASQFRVVEVDSITFDENVTETLDGLLRSEVERQATYRASVRLSWLFGALFINGAWSWPFWLVAVLSGCGAAGLPAPLATFETASSEVAIFQVDQQTDLTLLILASGLDPSVRDTLARLRGQQIAVISLQTQPPVKSGGTSASRSGQPGLHLSWSSRLVPQSTAASQNGVGGPTYSYPLGTGSAWAHPIELTRVYVTAPPGVDFATSYPRLGTDASGYTGGGWSSRSLPRIQSADGPAFAVDEAVGGFGRVWRITYRQSNSAEDVLITRLPSISQHTQSLLRHQSVEDAVRVLTWLAAPLAALLIWFLSWWLVMRRMGKSYNWRDPRSWLEALGWALLYPLINGLVVVGAVILLMLSAGTLAVLVLPVLLLTLLGTVGIYLFARQRSTTLGVSKGKAAVAYLATMLLANLLYLPLGVLFLVLTRG